MRAAVSRLTTTPSFIGIYHGAKGLAWAQVTEAAKWPEGVQSPVRPSSLTRTSARDPGRTGAMDGDIIFFGADSKKVVADATGARLKLGRDLPGGERLAFPCRVIGLPCLKKMMKAAWRPCTTPSPAPSK